MLRVGLAIEEQLADVRALMRRYRDHPMSLADACLVRLAELHAGGVFEDVGALGQVVDEEVAGRVLGRFVVRQTASAVALVVFQSWVCFCLSSHTRASSTAWASPMTSSNASIISACVSIGARYHHQLSSVSRQNMPISSLLTERSLIERMMPWAVSRSANRLSAIIAPLS